MGILTTTSEDKKIPTDHKLDSDIEHLKWMIHNYTPFVKSIIKRKIILIIKHKWQKHLKWLMITVAVLTGVVYGYVLYMRPVVNNIIIQHKISKIEQEIISNPIPKGNLDFMVAVSLLESESNYQKCRINSQYWGAYQMGEAARKDVGLGGLSKNVFLNNKAIQNWAMNQYMKQNYEYLKDVIVKYNVPQYGGIRVGMHLVTISGMIAAAHLCGYTAVITFFNSNGTTVERDGNDKPLTDYLELNNFKLEFE